MGCEIQFNPPISEIYYLYKTNKVFFFSFDNTTSNATYSFISKKSFEVQESCSRLLLRAMQPPFRR